MLSVLQLVMRPRITTEKHLHQGLMTKCFYWHNYFDYLLVSGYCLATGLFNDIQGSICYVWILSASGIIFFLVKMSVIFISFHYQNINCHYSNSVSKLFPSPMFYFLFSPLEWNFKFIFSYFSGNGNFRSTLLQSTKKVMRQKILLGIVYIPKSTC